MRSSNQSGRLNLSIELPEHKLIASIIYEELRSAIIHGKLKEGQRVVEADLVKTFGTSRTPVRDALSILAADGFVELTPYRGATISKINPRDIKEHFEIKAMVEGFSAFIGAERFSTEEISELEAILEGMKTHITLGNLEGILQSNFHFHKKIVDSVGNEKLSKYYESLSHSIRRYGTIGLTDQSVWDISLYEHQQILETIKARKPVTAEEQSRMHALSTMKRILQKLSREIWDSQVAPLRNDGK